MIDMTRSRSLTAVAASILLLTGCATTTALADTPRPASTQTTAAPVSSLIATTTQDHDTQITGSIAAPQIILTTPAAVFDGGPVRVSLTAEYANMIPDPTSDLNGLGFELYVDGSYICRLGLFGSHSQVSMFGPVNISAILDEASAIPAGTHTISIGAWRWSPGGDGYLKASDGGAPAVPIRLAVERM